MSGIDVIVLVLAAVNLVLIALTIALVLRRTGGAEASSATATVVQDELRRGNVEVRQDLATQRSELRQNLSEELGREREARAAANAELNTLLAKGQTELSDRLHRHAQTTLQSQVELLAAVEERFEALRKENEARLEAVRQTLAEQLEKLRQGNETKLEKMRETVDEKLQGTLEKRLGESFSLVSERLEQVQKGLGEMQTLASDVGGLKRVLTNVKSRGSWGEVQLARQLEDMLTPDQYEENVAIRPDSRDSVEFAVKLPGRSEYDSAVYLPIDSKFPQEDYERLLEAQEVGEKDQIDIALRNVERVIITQAKLISEKYIAPPRSTDFAIMYLPTEGLFAEVVRRPGLASKLQNEHRILVTGPTTLMSLLNSLQMGFRTLAIEQRSSEVWQVLSAAKHEFEKYGEVWKKLEKQLQAAQNTVHQAGVRTRAVTSKLRTVESLDLSTAEGQSLSRMFGEQDELEASIDEETAVTDTAE